MLTDAHARARVLNPTVSAAVTASAGSGKTESLALAYLTRLAVADRPEELLTLTYTRKACAELQQRVLDIIAEARSGKTPDSDHGALRQKIGGQALARSANKGWDLEHQPNALKFMTYDSFFQSLATMLPGVNGIHESFKVTEDGGALYDEAVNRLLSSTGDTGTDNAVDYLWAHFDGSEERMRRLLVHMLAFREQWLEAVLSVRGVDDLGCLFTETLNFMIVERLGAASGAICKHWTLLLSVLDGQGDYFDPDSPLFTVAQLGRPLSSDLASFEDWKALANWVLTKGGAARRSFNKHQGFPAKAQVAAGDYEASVERKTELLEWLQSDDAAEAIAALVDIQKLPEADLSISDLETLRALVKVLIMGAAQLQMVFQERNRCDHIEYAMRALVALGHESAPSELALRMDCALGHILCDEFQDTNAVQFAALTRLVSGWEAGDGRTFIAVGDPKQSIYSFRKANPALFIEACERGLGELALESLVLETNFRSDQAVIQWVDEVFSETFPAQADLQRGGVPHSRSSTVRTNKDQSGVRLLGATGETVEAARRNEAQVVIEQIQGVLRNDPDASIAVLVKSRRAAGPLLEQFVTVGMPVKAIDMFPLAGMDAVQDVVSLAKYIVEPCTVQYGYEWLRARSVGLSLADLDALAEVSGGNLVHRFKSASLSEDGTQRAARILPVLESAHRMRGRETVREITEKVWLTLGGCVYLSNDGERSAIEQVLALIGDLETDNELTVSTLDRRLSVRHGSSLPDASANIEVMTVHRSKGQEYDYVFVMGAGAASRSNERPALLWEGRNGGLVMAPISETGSNVPGVYGHLYENERARKSYELSRELYVAVTRARTRATLSLSCTEDQSISYRPAANSLIGQAFNAILSQTQLEWCVPEQSISTQTVERGRCAAGWAMRWRTSNALTALPVEPVFAVSRDELLGGLNGRSERMVGKVGHTLMEHVVRGQRGKQYLTTLGERLLSQHGLGNRDLPSVLLAMIEKQSHSRLIDDLVGQAVNTEFRLSEPVNGKTVERRIDLWFVDQLEGVIVDHKFTVPEAGESLPAFANRMAIMHKPKMDAYRAGMSGVHPDLNWVAYLYFPALDLLVSAKSGAVVNGLSQAA